MPDYSEGTTYGGRLPDGWRVVDFSYVESGPLENRVPRETELWQTEWLVVAYQPPGSNRAPDYKSVMGGVPNVEWLSWFLNTVIWETSPPGNK